MRDRRAPWALRQLRAAYGAGMVNRDQLHRRFGLGALELPKITQEPTMPITPVADDSETYEFGDFRIDRSNLKVSGRSLRLTRSQHRVLMALIREHGGPVPPDLLAEAASVKPGALKVHVHALRGTLGATTIDTLYGRGYRVRPHPEFAKGVQP